MACPEGFLTGCDFVQALVDQTPHFDKRIMDDITPTDGWIGNVSLYQVPAGTPPEVTQDRMRTVMANVTKAWRRTGTPGCDFAACDPPQHRIGWGSDRLTFFEQEITWATPLFCADQLYSVSHAKEQIDNIIDKTLKPNTQYIGSHFLRKETLFWSKYKQVANRNFGRPGTDGVFTYQWVLGGAALDEEMFLDTSVAPSRVFLLMPQMLQNEFGPLMREGYGGENPFKDTAEFIEIVLDMNTIHQLEHAGGSYGTGGGNNPGTASNWRFEQFSAASKYWRYGFGGQIGNYMARLDEFGLRFNYVGDLGAGAHGGNGNRHRYQIVLPYTNEVTTGAGGSAGLGRVPNRDFDAAQFAIAFISHKMGLMLGVPEVGSINPEMPFKHRNLAGKWEFHMDNLGEDENGVAINNEWRNKGKFAAWFKYYTRPLHYEFLEALFIKRENFCIPEIGTCHADPGYPEQCYDSVLPNCPVPEGFAALYGTGVPTGDEDGPILSGRPNPNC